MKATPHTDGRHAARPLRVMMLGLRGCPGVQGGVEKHVEELAPRLVEAGCEVEVLARQPYLTQRTPHAWRGVRVTPLWSPSQRSLEAIAHTLRGVLYAARHRPDILHIHAIGPALLTPLARLAGLRVVVTHHGYDYERDKWGTFARTMLRLGEHLGMRLAHARIAVSRTVAARMSEVYRTPVDAIPNGVAAAEPPATTATLQRFALDPQRYVLAVGRLVPEKRHPDLIAAFARADLAGWKLVIVGTSDHPDAYMRSVEDTAHRTAGVVLAGFQSGIALQELYAHAGLFVLPSTHEGLPIVLLEALAAGLPCLASDIAANREIGLPEEAYFPAGNVAALAERIKATAGSGLDHEACAARRAGVLRDFDWSAIAERTASVYRRIARPAHATPDPEAAASTLRKPEIAPGRESEAIRSAPPPTT